MEMKRRFASCLLAAVIVVFLPLTAFAKGPDKKVVDYVALGDSLAAGMTPTGGLDLGYADYLVSRFEQSQYTVGYTNFGVPGYTSTHLMQDVLTRADVQGKITEAEFITVDIGANDLLKALNTPDQIPAVMGTVAVNLQAVLSTIDQLNPKAKVYVMGYYNPFPHYPQEQQDALLPLLGTLNQVIESRAAANGDTFVPTEKIIAKHYEVYLPNPSNIHLSKEGYQLVAKEFWKNIDKSKN
ncbi:SGNH/GDSL hydrolase family protein [Siminovitchia acidinfaciens]|nr:SGNH/GDSL hydrolase family protein [Siminovitchia acidinfaciens]